MSFMLLPRAIKTYLYYTVKEYYAIRLSGEGGGSFTDNDYEFMHR